MRERVQRMALRTWDCIGPDTFRCLEDAGEKPIMTKADVIETVCDAGYMKIYGGDEEAYHWWNSLKTFELKVEVVREAFKFERYGW